MLRDKLTEGVERLGLSIDENQIIKLLDYLNLLQKWNKVYNLTAVRQSDDMVTHHLIDSLSIIQSLLFQTKKQSIRLLDVGSGGGLPGVVIAIVCPQIAVTCVDSVGKKAAFIQQVATALRLSNLVGVHDRVENLARHGEGGFDVVCSRAFASLADFTHLSRPALACGGVWMAMKGRLPSEEIAALSGDIDMFHVEHLRVPGLAAERCLVWLRSAKAAAV